jgi:hypothetical protein
MATLRYISEDLYRYALLLGDEHGGKLTPLQQGRVNEIVQACGYLQAAVQTYEAALATGNTDYDAPRSRLLYAGRVPLEMIAIATHLLRLYHARKTALLTNSQHNALRQIEIDCNGLMQEIERLWKAMQTNRQQRDTLKPTR